MSAPLFNVADLDQRPLSFLPALRTLLKRGDMAETLGIWRNAPALNWLNRADSAVSGQ